MGRKSIAIGKKRSSQGPEICFMTLAMIKLYIGTGSTFIIHTVTQSSVRVKHCLLTDIFPTPLLFNVCNL